MLRATQESLDAACLAIKNGWGINLSGGYHHASKFKGEGFWKINLIISIISLILQFIFFTKANQVIKTKED